MKKILGVSGEELSQIIVGITLVALGVNWFIAPLGLVTGGLTGLAIVIEKVTSYFFGYGVPLYMTNIVLNIPLFMMVMKQRGFAFAQRSLVAVLWLSLALWYCQYIPNFFEVGDDILLGAVFGGAFLGSGIGIVLRISVTTGGTDTLATIVKYKFPSFPIAKLIRIIDGGIIISGFFAFGPRKGMYAIIAMIIGSHMVNFWLSGMHFAKAVFIISNKNQELSVALMKELGRGTTGIKAKGMYTKDDKEMLFIVVTPKQVAKLRQVVRAVDEQAFVTISDAKEVLGEGFNRDYDSLGF